MNSEHSSILFFSIVYLCLFWGSNADPFPTWIEIETGTLRSLAVSNCTLQGALSTSSQSALRLALNEEFWDEADPVFFTYNGTGVLIACREFDDCDKPQDTLYFHLSRFVSLDELVNGAVIRSVVYRNASDAGAACSTYYAVMTDHDSGQHSNPTSNVPDSENSDLGSVGGLSRPVLVGIVVGAAVVGTLVIGIAIRMWKNRERRTFFIL
eukprot:ANDGO_01074.mRNA.1 hypothetical protein